MHQSANQDPDIEECESRDRVAHHEAGHVVAAMHLEIPVLHVRIEDAPDANGRWSGFTKPEYVVNGAESFERTATYFWAGAIAERAHITEKHVARPLVSELVTTYGGVLDVAQMKRYAADLGITAWSRPTRRASANLVRDNWTEIERWAIRLDQAGSFVATSAGSFRMGSKHFKTIEDALADRDGLAHQEWLKERMADHVDRPHS